MNKKRRREKHSHRVLAAGPGCCGAVLCRAAVAGDGHGSGCVEENSGLSCCCWWMRTRPEDGAALELPRAVGSGRGDCRAAGRPAVTAADHGWRSCVAGLCTGSAARLGKGYGWCWAAGGLEMLDCWWLEVRPCYARGAHGHGGLGGCGSGGGRLLRLDVGVRQHEGGDAAVDGGRLLQLGRRRWISLGLGFGGDLGGLVRICDLVIGIRLDNGLSLGMG